MFHIKLISVDLIFVTGTTIQYTFVYQYFMGLWVGCLVLGRPISPNIQGRHFSYISRALGKFIFYQSPSLPFMDWISPVSILDASPKFTRYNCCWEMKCNKHPKWVIFGERFFTRMGVLQFGTSSYFKKRLKNRIFPKKPSLTKVIQPSIWWDRSIHSIVEACLSRI